jgi:hypothetical protein
MTGPDFSRPRAKTEPDFERYNTTSKRGTRHEKRIAKRTGDKRVSGSGNKPGRPADLRGDTFLREAKTTKGAGRMISGRELAKIVEQAMALNKIPVMEICFEGQVIPVPNDWVLIPADDFDRLLGGV